jgi:C4-dicarboxylate transporter DctM subunit
MSLREWRGALWQATKEAFWALLMPVIILGGIYAGVFTPTEASVVAVVYGVFIGMFVYGELSWKQLLPIFSKSMVATSLIMLIVGYAAIFGYEQVPQNLGRAIATFSSNPIVFMLLVNILLFVVGTLMEALVTIILIGPILAPVAVQFGIDPVHFGIVMIVNVAIGMLTPPVAVNLVVACKVAKLRMSDLTAPVCLYLGVLTIDVLIISYVPALSTWLPQLMK